VRVCVCAYVRGCVYGIIVSKCTDEAVFFLHIHTRSHTHVHTHSMSHPLTIMGLHRRRHMCNDLNTQSDGLCAYSQSCTTLIIV